jgi:hypothetical protein
MQTPTWLLVLFLGAAALLPRIIHERSSGLRSACGKIDEYA